MAAPIVKNKRSSVPGKVPTTTDLSLGEFGINTNDGKVFISATNAVSGVGTTVITVNPWSVGLGTTAYNTYFIAGNVGVGTTNPTSNLHVYGTLGVGTVIKEIPYDTLNFGTLSWEGSAGQLFSITNNLSSGSIFSVNDISGIPSIDVNADGTIHLGAYGGNVGIGTTRPNSKLTVLGNVLVGTVSSTGTSNQLLQVSGGAYFDSNVGIGVSNPAVKFDCGAGISSTLTAVLARGNDGGFQLSAQNGPNTNSSGSEIFRFGSNYYGAGWNSYLQFLRGGSTQDGSIALFTNNIERVRFNNSGLVGIGTSSPIATLHVQGDLYVSNNISFGGTTTQLNVNQLNVLDPDIVLGIGTSFSPTDNTANHGGIAIASTEGTPLVSLNIVAGETNPTTYKKIMWFKGSTIGAGLTDAWLANYAVGIGSTRVPNNVYLAAGNVQITQNDISVVRNINASGIVTVTSGPVFIGSATSTGTASQPLQVTGSAYVSGNLGLGTTNPTQELDVNGDVRIRGGIYDSNNTVGAAGSVLSSTGTGVSWTQGGMRLIDTQTFSSVGVGTWTKPSNSTFVIVYAIGGGGGGASGGASNNVAFGGAGGGSAGATVRMLIPTVLLGATESVTVGTGGIGGTAVSVTYAGSNISATSNPGVNGGDTRFGNWVLAEGGNGGTINASNAAVGGGGAAIGVLAGYSVPVESGGAGGDGAATDNNPVATSVVNTINMSAGGGSGGPAPALGTLVSGIAGGTAGIVTGGTLGAGSATVGVAGGAGGPGSTSANGLQGSGGGGGGNAVATSAVAYTNNAGIGGTGGIPGGGGGGGGSARVSNVNPSTANAGKGGDGARGLVVVYSYG